MGGTLRTEKDKFELKNRKDTFSYTKQIKYDQ